MSYVDSALTSAPVAACSLFAILLSGSASGQGPGTGLPSDLLPVKGGQVALGMSAADLFEVSGKLSAGARKARAAILKNTISELGESSKQVNDFLLAKTEVTNEQYAVFVEKTKRMPPLNWWREGNPKEYAEKQKDFNLELKDRAGFEYFKQHWKDLKWQVPAGKEKHPVTMISWRDAMAYAAWTGMRLPTEAEWTLAATAGKKAAYLSGDKPPKIASQLSAVGGGMAGPFGHLDLTGSVWEFVDTDGYFPISGQEAFSKEYDKLKKLKGAEEFLKDLDPTWDGSKRVAKGGAFLSAQQPVQLRVGVRSPPLDPSNGVESVGFRVAKSIEPGRDLAYALLRVDYDYPSYGADQKPSQLDVVGIERYELDADGTKILDFRGISVIPVNQLADSKESKQLGQEKLRHKSLEHPLVLGVIALTEALEEPKLEPGTYTLMFRARGLPAELQGAISEGIRESKSKPVDDEKEKKKKEAKGDAEKPDKNEAKRVDWRTVLAKYGVSEDPAILKELQGSSGQLTLKDGNYKIPTSDDLILFYKSGTGFVSHMKSRNDLGIRGGYKGASISVGKKAVRRDNKESTRQLYKIEFGVPHMNQHAVFYMELLSVEPLDPAKVWRTPAVAKSDLKKDDSKDDPKNEKAGSQEKSEIKTPAGEPKSASTEPAASQPSSGK